MTINSFSGNYAWLSNFSPSIVLVNWWDQGPHGMSRAQYEFPTVEHAFQASKVAISGYEAQEQFHGIRKASTPGKAKKLGRKVGLVHDWEDIKVDVMRGLLKQKFRNPDLRAALLATRPHHLVEGNNWGDRFWGVEDGNGENMLGTLLMEIRREIV